MSSATADQPVKPRNPGASGHPDARATAGHGPSGRAPGSRPKPPKINLFSEQAGKTVRLSIALSVLTSAATAFTFVFLGNTFQALVYSEPYGGNLVATVVFAVLAAGLSAYVIGMTGTAAVREEGQVRRRIIDHVFALGPVDRTHERSGALASQATDGVERLSLFKLTFFGPMIASAISPVVVLLIVGLTIDWFAAAMLLLAVPAIPLLVGGFQRAFRKVSGNSREARQRLAAEYLDAIQGLTTLGLLNASQRTQDRLAESGERNRRSIMRLLASNQLVILVVDGVFSLFMIAMVAWLAMSRLDAGAITLGQAVSLLLVSFVLLEPLGKVGEFFYIGMGGLAAQRGIRGFLSQPVRVRAGRSALPTKGSLISDDPAASQPIVEFRGAHFAYGEFEVLKGVSFAVYPGEHVAIVGQSGAGKSTIASLVQRNIPIGDGELFLAGADANTLTTDSARSLSATVGQTTFLFTGTLRENLQIAKPDATDEELWAVLETANLTQEIQAMPQGLDTVVGERGYSLSGGQAQRLAIARALLKDAPLLILDEPTSQVDLEGEAAILAAIDNAVAGRTVLTIAHRPSTLRSVDRILTLADGNLTELGAGSTSNDGEES